MPSVRNLGGSQRKLFKNRETFFFLVGGEGGSKGFFLPCTHLLRSAVQDLIWLGKEAVQKVLY